jgi:hypothetical protein
MCWLSLVDSVEEFSGLMTKQIDRKHKLDECMCSVSVCSITISLFVKHTVRIEATALDIFHRNFLAEAKHGVRFPRPMGSSHSFYEKVTLESQDVLVETLESGRHIYEYFDADRYRANSPSLHLAPKHSVMHA